MMILIAPVGALSDRIGRKPLLLASAIGFLVLSYPAVALLGMGSPLPVTAGVAILGLLLLLMLGTIGSALPAIFPCRNRYGGFSIGYSLSTAAFGGTAPLIIEALIGATGDTFVLAYYLMGAAVIAIVPIVLMPETAGKRIDHPTQIPGREPALTAA
jgi:MFS transporter, MHS family, proline/betaine transporter